MGNSRVRQKILLVMIVILIVVIAGIIIMTGYKKSTVPKIGLIITGSKTDAGWNGVHYQGVSYACDKLDAELIVKENVPENAELCEEAIRALVDDGAGMIILSSYAYPGAYPEKVKSVIESYPEVAFYGSSAEYYADNMTSYFGRMYQARYLAGIIAGMTTENNRIGYVAAMSNIEVNRGINAFTLGVRSVNPEAVVNVVWTGSWDNEKAEIEATSRLIYDKDIDLVTYHQNRHYVAQTADEAGIYSIGYHEAYEGGSDNFLTAVEFRWDITYKELLSDYVRGKSNVVNTYWFGLEKEAIGLTTVSPLVGSDVIADVETAKNEIISGDKIFSGVIYDNQGQLRCHEDEIISDQVLMNNMDWYVEGVYIYEE